MWVKQAIAVALIAAGVLALAYGRFSYTTETHEANIAGLEFSLKEKETFKVPTWAGAGAIAAGTLLLMFGRRK